MRNDPGILSFIPFVPDEAALKCKASKFDIAKFVGEDCESTGTLNSKVTQVGVM